MGPAVTIDIGPKRQYKPLYTKQAPYKLLWGGRGRGGSHEATLYSTFRITSPDYCRIAFVRKIFNDVKLSLWRDFKDRIDESQIPMSDFHFNDNGMEATYKLTGNFVKAIGVKAEGGRTAKLKSLAGYNLVVIEEMDELIEDEFDQLDDSIRTVKGLPPEIIGVFNPPGRHHWIWKRWFNLIESEVKGYWKAVPKESSNILSIFGTYQSNIVNIAATKIEKWEGYKLGNPDYYQTVIRGLIGEGQRGRIYTGWTPITQEQFQQVEARSIWWLDFGWSESPMALGEMKFVKNRRYAREHFYRPSTLKEVAIHMCKIGLTGSDLIIADSEDSISINKLRSGWTEEELTTEERELYPQLMKGFYVFGAIKPPGSLMFGINQVKEVEMYVCEDSQNIWAEYRNYKWALDKDKNPTNTPEDNWNHHMDGIRYLETGKGRLGY